MSSPLSYDSWVDLSGDESEATLLSLRDRQLRAVFETALDAIAIADDRGRYLDVNPAACELFGLERNELLGRSIYEFAESGFNFSEAWQEFQQQEKLRGEFRLLRPDGKIRVVEYAATANFLPSRHLSVMRDITERKQAEAQVRELKEQLNRQVGEPVSELEKTQIQLRKSQQQLESILSSIDGAVWSIHPETFKTIYLNNAVEEIFGCSMTEFFANPNFWFERIHPDDRGGIATVFVRLNEQGRTKTEYRIIRPDGQVRWLSVNSHLVCDETGKAIRIDGITTDITDRVESQSRLEQIARHIPGIIYQFRMRPDGTFHFPYSSEKIQEICGISPEEVREDAAKLFTIIYSEDRDRVTQSILASAEQLTLWHCEYRICLPDGKLIWLLGQATPQREPDGSTIWHGYIKDITQRKRTEAENQLLHTILETAPDLIGIVDLTGKALYLNRVWRNLVNINDDKTLAEMEIAKAHPEWALDIVLNQGLPEASRLGSWQGETAIFDATGREIPVSQVIVAHKSIDGKVEFFSTIIRDITEIKAKEQALRNSENKFRSIIENINDLVYIINPDSTFSYLSPKFKEVMGYELSEILGKSFAVFIYPEDFPKCMNAFQSSLQGEKVQGIEYRILHRDGKYYWHSSNLSALKDENGEIVYCLGVARYIHDRKQAEIALRESEIKFSTIFDTSPDPVWIATLAEGRCLNVNESLCQFLEAKNKDIIGKTCVELGLWDNLEDLHYFRQTLIEKRNIQNYEVVIRTASRQAKTVLMSATVEWLDGQDCVIGLMKDISDRKVAELELEQFFDLALDLLCIADLEGHFRRVNRAWESILGYSTKELEGQLFLDFVHPDDIASTLEAMSELSEQNPVLQFTNRYRAKDGNYRYIEWRSMPSGELIYAAARDITDRKQAEIEHWQMQNFLNSIVENIPNMIFVKDANTLQFLRFNKAGEELLGYPKEALLGKSDYDFFPPEEAAFFIAKDRESLAEGKVLDIPEESVQTSHQGTRILHTRKVPIFDEFGKPKYILGISEDITDRKQAEAQVQEISERLSLALKSGGIGCWEWDIVQNSLVWDDQMYELYGINKDVDTRLAYEIWANGLHPDDRDNSETLLRQAVLGEAEFDAEFRVIHPDGSIHFIKAFGLVRWDAQGNPQKMIGVNFDISDRKQAEIQLKQSQKRYEILAEASPIGVYLTDAKGDCVYVNESWSKTTGLTKEEAIGPDWAKTLHPEDRERVFQEWYETALVKQQFQSEYRFLHRNGRVVWAIGQALPLINTEGEIEGYVGTVTDITDRKQGENALRASEEKLRSLFDLCPVGIALNDMQGRFLEVNSAAETIYGYSLEELNQLSYLDLTPKKYADEETHQIELLNTIGRFGPYQKEYIRRDGSLFPVELLGVLVTGKDGNQYIWSIIVDITERKRQEQALRLIVEGTAAKTGEEFFKSCVQYLAQVLEVQYALIAEFVDSEKLSAKTLAFWVGDKFGDNFTYNLIGAPCENVFTQGELCLYPNSVQSLFPKDVDLVALQVESYAGLPIIDVEGNLLGLLAVLDTKPMVQDREMQSAILRIFATRAGAEMERINAEAAVRASEIQLRQQTEELETTLKKLQATQTQLIQAEKMSSLGQLVAGIAHEINNPVSFIYGNLEPATDYANNLIDLIRLYQEHYPSPSPIISDFTEDIDFEYLASDFAKLLESMNNGATRIRDIVKSLRTFSRLDEADLKPVDIHENIESTLMILQNRLNSSSEKTAISVVKNYGNLPLVECYGGLLNQVFLNLLVNAIDAIEQRRESLESTEKLNYVGEITIATSTTSENQVLISINDNGCGMGPEVQEKIFNPFFTTKPVGKGTGMGLATSYQIVTENHQGHLRCCSILGKGTEFRIELPVVNRNVIGN